MNVGIDGRALQGNRAGVGRYVFELCRALNDVMPDAKFFVYNRDPVEMPIVSSRWVPRVETSSLFRTMPSILWFRTRVGALCREDGVQAFWGCTSFLPRLPKNVRSVLTVYDLNYKLVPDTMHTAALWQYRIFFRHELASADSVLAISRGTADRLREYFGRSTDGIVYPTISPLFGPQSATEIRECRQRHGLGFPYLLAVGTWEPRKNLDLLLDAIIAMKACGELGQRRLVLVGGRGWKDDRLGGRIGTLSGLVEPLGYVSDLDLPKLYAGADAFVFPSIYEGFGMPVLEARACGTPIVTTDSPELREAGGPDAVYVTPTLDGIRNGIKMVLRPDYPRRAGSVTWPTWEDGATALATTLRGAL